MAVYLSSLSNDTSSDILTRSRECKSERVLNKPGMCCEGYNILYFISAKANLLTKIMVC